MKNCSKCHIEKPVHEFNMDKSKPTGYTYQCKACRLASTKAWRATPEGRDKWNAAQREIYHREPVEARQRRYDIVAKKPWLPRAHNAVAYAIRTGKIPRSEVCEVGDGCSGRVHYHHDSYKHGLELAVRPMCAKHHKLWHMVNTPELP